MTEPDFVKAPPRRSARRRLALVLLAGVLAIVAALAAGFEAAYRRRFAFLMEGRGLVVEAVSVEAIAAGDALLSPSVTKRVIRQFTRIPRASRPSELDELTAREEEILRLIAAGLSNAEIGQRLYIGETTVKTHVTHVLQKLGLRDRVQAVVLAHQTGLLETGT